MKPRILLFVTLLCLLIPAAFAFSSLPTSSAQTAFSIKDNYTKHEYQIAMRDGVKLFTSVYAPKDTSQKYPMVMQRTPYSVAPYGAEAYRNQLGPSSLFAKEGFIFVYQDVRGRTMSEGDFAWMRPYKPKKASATDADETTDTWDTIEWLLKNIPNNNGRVGMWGISYPGHYAAQALIDPHPALKAVSPQAPMADNWLGDDMHHNGALFSVARFQLHYQLRQAANRAWRSPVFALRSRDGGWLQILSGNGSFAQFPEIHEKRKQALE
ncbi:MAG: CocE/NonD family hydrolase [Blastocatellia bacterium]